MPTFDRTTIVRGPCKIGFDSQTFYSKGSVTVTVANATFDKTTDAYGPVGKTKTDLTVVVEFEPVGEIEALAVLFPYGNTAMGASIYGATDKALTIVSADSTYTIKNAQVTSMPSIRCTAGNTAFGSVTFTGLISNNGDPSDVTDYFAIGAGASIGTSFDPSKLITAPYTATLGAIGPFYSEAGFEVSFDLSLNPIVVDGIGTVDMTMASLGANITFIPTGIAQDDLDALFDGLDSGEDLASSALQIVTPTVGGLNFNVAAAQLIDVQRRFSASENRLGTVNLAAKRTFSTGAPVALFTIAAVTAP